jgi:hypothetical protein
MIRIMQSAIEISPVEIRLVRHASLAIIRHGFGLVTVSCDSSGFLNKIQKIMLGII